MTCNGQIAFFIPNESIRISDQNTCGPTLPLRVVDIWPHVGARASSPLAFIHTNLTVPLALHFATEAKGPGERFILIGEAWES